MLKKLVGWFKSFLMALLGIFCRNVRENREAIAKQVASDVREAVAETRK